MANNPNAAANLVPASQGEVRNPNGRPKGSLNRQTILEKLLFSEDLDPLQFFKNKPAWTEKVKPKTLYEMMTLAISIKAMTGDAQAYNAINKALGEQVDIKKTTFMHIYRPEKASEDQVNEIGTELRKRASDAIEGEVVDNNGHELESTSGSAGTSA